MQLKSPPIAVLDANVLYPFTLRDTLLRLAELGLYQPKWTLEILDEVTRNLLKLDGFEESDAQNLVSAMNAAFDDAIVKDDYQLLIPSMKNDAKDRHVLAAAVACEATYLVTENIKDFRNVPVEINALRVDEFLMSVVVDRQEAERTISDQARALKNPPRTTDDILRTLAKHAPTFVSWLRT